MIKHIKKSVYFIAKKAFSIILCGKLWLTLLSTLTVMIVMPKYYIVKTEFSGIAIYNINWYVFGSIAAVCSGIFYPLFNYICNLKTKYQKRANDILFVCLFFILLFIPAAKIDTNKYSDTENRELAQFVPLFVDNKVNNNFGKDFEKWFNDRFFTRPFLVKFYNDLVYFINNNYNTKKVIINKRQNWFFFKNEIVQTYKTPANDDLTLIKDNISSLNDFCLYKNIKLYFVILPAKCNVYKEFVPSYNIKNQKPYGAYIDEFLKNSTEFNTKLIYPLNDILKAKNTNSERIYFSTDSHMTPFGGYVAYLAIMKEIQKDFPDMKIAGLDEFIVKKNRLVNINEKETEDFTLGSENTSSIDQSAVLDYEYSYYYPKKEPKHFAYDDPHVFKSKSFNPDGKRKLLLIGSSAAEQPKIFFRQSFKSVDKIRLNNSYEKNFHLSRFERHIEKEKPDVLVVIMSEFEARDYIKSMYDESVELEP